MDKCNEGEGADDSSTVFMSELAITVDRFNTKKVADIDSVPGSIIKLIYKYRPHDLLNKNNNIYNLGKMPRKCKVILLKDARKRTLPPKV